MSSGIRVRLNGRRVTVRPGMVVWFVHDFSYGVDFSTIKVGDVRRGHGFDPRVQVMPDPTILGGWADLESGWAFLDEREAIERALELLAYRKIRARRALSEVVKQERAMRQRWKKVYRG